MLEFLNKLGDNSFLTALVGALVGGVISMATSILIYKLQKRDEQHKERMRRYELRGEFAIEHACCLDKDTVLAKMEVFLSTYKPVKQGDYVDFTINKVAKDKSRHCHETFYIRNIGQSTINQLDLCVTSPSSIMILPYQQLSYYVDSHFTSFSILCDERIPPKGLLQIDLYYREDDPVLNAFSSTLGLAYMDAMHEIYKQPFFPESRKIYEPGVLSWKEYNYITRSQLVEECVAQGFLRKLSFNQQKRR